MEMLTVILGLPKVIGDLNRNVDMLDAAVSRLDQSPPVVFDFYRMEGAFAFAKVGRGSGIPLAVILKRRGIDYGAAKHIFIITIFNYLEAGIGYELAIEPEVLKEPYTGKPRERKRKSVNEPTSA